MPVWDVSPAGVQAVLNRVQEVASAFEQPIDRSDVAMQDAAPHSSSGVVAQALQSFAESVGRDIRSVVTQTGAAMTGCAEAVNAYVVGDLEMAATARQSEAGMPRPDRFMPGTAR